VLLASASASQRPAASWVNSSMAKIQSAQDMNTREGAGKSAGGM